MVVGLLVLVSIALIALSTSFTLHARRTQAAVAGAQLRQLLLAAPAYARAELATRGSAPEPREVPIPVPADDATLTITITNSPSATADLPVATVLATARFRTFKAVQRLDFQRTATGWSLLATQLQQSP
jgi:hypothetical protein